MKYDIGSGWAVQWFKAQPSGAPEQMEFYGPGDKHPRVILNADSIERLRTIFARVDAAA